MTVLEVEDIKKIYRPRFGGNQVQALSKVTFSVEEGEYVSIMGESGSGKTTLLLGKKSTGIGLYLSQMAAKKLGHTISVESIPGEGSSFKIDLSSYALQVE